MKLSVKLFSIACGIVLLNACENTTSTQTTTATPPTTSTVNEMPKDTAVLVATGATVAASPEQDFINYAVPANTKEIMWLKAGMTKGNKDTKQHATMMLKDHTKLDATVKGWMSKHSDMIVPTLDTANVVNINDKTGKDWDKAFADKMVDDHKDLLGKLKDAKEKVKDADLNKIISNTIPVVQSHLDMSKMMAEKMKK